MTRAPGHLFQRRTIDPNVVLATLDRIEQTHRSNAWAAIAGGVVLCAFSVLLLCVFYVVISWSWIVNFKVTFLLFAVLFLPLLFLLAIKVQGSVLEATVPGSDLLQTRIIGGRVVGVLFIAEMANVGPRLTLWGISQVRGRSAFGTLPHDRVAAALLTLADADTGISPAKLLLPGESADMLEPILGTLLYFDLADISKNADKVWITTEAKKKLGLVA